MNELKKMSGSWVRAFLAAVITLAASGVTDPQALIYAGAAAILPPVLRWLNPKDDSYGIAE
jgi:hypothetical protein